jgi:hypothetical protein
LGIKRTFDPSRETECPLTPAHDHEVSIVCACCIEDYLDRLVREDGTDLDIDAKRFSIALGRVKDGVSVFFDFLRMFGSIPK